MADYLDLGVGIHHMVDTVDDPVRRVNYLNKENAFNKAHQHGPGHTKASSDTWYHSVISKRPRVGFPKWTLDPRFLEVRQSICVTGFHRDAVQLVKNKMGSLLDEPIPLESFHIHRMSDLKEGTLLVPKIVMVAMHCPGKKLIDEEGNEGQLDFLYDEICDLGADVMVVYLGLPRSIYPPFRHMVYHPKMADILFPSQPLLREWAEANSFITVTEDCDFTNMQKNVLKEWMRKPVNESHQIYKSAECLSASEWSFSDAEFYSEPDTLQRSRSVPTTSVTIESEFVPAEEHHPLAEDRKRKKKSRRKNLFRLGRKEKREEERKMDLITLEEDDVELELYNAGGNPYAAYNNTDTLSNISV